MEYIIFKILIATIVYINSPRVYLLDINSNFNKIVILIIKYIIV